MIHKPNPDWSNHIPMLLQALIQTKGPVLELGMGISSTPLLHMFCSHENRQLTSYENDPIFIDMFKKFSSKDHNIILVKDWDKADLNQKWSVALIDHKPEERRKVDITRLANLAEVLIVHDSEPEHNDLYHYDEIYPLFKHRYDYKRLAVHTTVLSNFHNVH